MTSRPDPAADGPRGRAGARGRASLRRQLRALLPGPAALPGLAGAGVVVALAFVAAAALPAIPAMTLCVAAGAVLGNVLRGRGRSSGPGAALSPGMDYAGTLLMRAGIVLLGLQLVLADVAALGLVGITAVLGVVVVAFAGTWATAKALRLPGDQPTLLAAGFSICGASAIGAVSQARGTARDASIPLALVTLCGTLSIAALPLLNTVLGLGPETFGHWVGASVHDVGQVVATADIADAAAQAGSAQAAATAGTTALAAAVVVKLLRVLALAPLAMLGAWSARRSASGAPGGAARAAGAPVASASARPDPEPVPAAPAAGGSLPPLVPGFVVGFALMVAARATGLLPEAVLEIAQVVQELLLGAALVGLGYAIDLRALVGSAGRATAAALIAWIVVALAGLGAAALISNGSFMV
ncbi:putative sulfate exporter family transporter [Zhihengliuella sp.]|uniref:YeiH family protein n=1 Tax=Zhihengliuella sp. TaxID=1954483 RepID=UPI00281107F9|nr:putative sulfate exporter family transporter [Zhihengliuella sp.]